MSFFGQLLAGATAGGAGGYIKDREDEERAAARLELKRIQYDQARLMQEDRQAFSREMALDRASRSSGSSSGGSGANEFNPAQAFERAYYEYGPDDPRTQRAYELVGRYTADGQRSLDPIMGRSTAQGGGYGEGAPTSADVLAAESYSGAPQPPANASRSKRDAMLGEQALLRFRAAVVDNGKNVDTMAKAEQNFRQNDLGDMAVVDSLKKGGSPEDAGNVFNRVANPAPYDMDGSAKTSRTEASANATVYKADKDAEKADATRVSGEIRSLVSAIADASKAPNMEDPDDRAVRLASLYELRAELKALREGRAQPAASKPKATISGGGKVATGKIGSWRDKAAAAGY